MDGTKGNRSILRAASYNIRKCVGLDWRRDAARTLSVIAEIDADIVALQEADKRLGDRPTALPEEAVEERTGLVPVALAPSPASLGWHGNAILLRPDIEVEELHRIELPSLEPRGAVIADLRRGDTELRIVAVHLGLMRRHRQRQLHAIRTELQGLDRRPTLIMGDFNEWSAERGVEPLEGAFTVLAPGHSFHASRPVAGLDRIAHCEALALANAGVIETPLARRASDHLPVWAEFTPA